MASPAPAPQPSKDPHATSPLEPTVVSFDPQGWTVVQASTRHSAVEPSAPSSQSKTGAPGALDDAVGQTLGPYEIQGVVARGGQGVVYKAKHKELGTLVALKILLAHKDPRSVQLFRQEAQILARLRHPNVIVVTDLGEMLGVPFLAMDYVKGSDLKKIVDSRGPLGIETARNLLAPIARTLKYCHDRGLVHRDVKPQNILIEEQTGRPILIDFGLVKRAEQFEREFGDITAPVIAGNEMGGTPSFMAPEQTGAPGFGPTGAASDIYGLGSTLYFLLTGKPPFVGPKTLQTLNMVIHQAPVDPREIRPEIPEDLAKLCLWAMAKNTKDRPASAEVFASVLKPDMEAEGDAAFYLERSAARRHEGDLPGALLDLARAAEMLAPGDELEQRVDEERRSVEAELARRGESPRTALWIGVGLVVLLLGAALAFALLREPRPVVDLSDKTPPELEFAPVAEWDGGPLAVSCTVKDAQPKGVSWQLVIDGRPLGSPFEAAVGPTGRVDARLDPASVTSSSIGALAVVAVAEDLAGNTTRKEMKVPIRRLPPRVTIESPRSGLVTSERTVAVRAVVGSGRLHDAEVVLKVGDEERLRRRLETGARDVVALDALPLPDTDGPCTIEVHGTDVIGNTGRAVSVVEVDRTPPSVEVLAPLGERWVREDKIAVRVRARDATALTVLLEGRPLGTDSDGDFSGPFHLAREGKNEGQLLVRDAAGNVTSATVVAVRDTTPPKLLEVRRTPADPQVTAERLSIVLVTDEPCTATVAGTLARASADQKTHTVDVPLALGRASLGVELTDALGNTAALEPPELAVERVLPVVLRPAWWPISPAQREHALANEVVVAFESASGMRFVLVPPGTFRMGSPEGEPGHESDEFPHQVTISRAFYMAENEVTNAQFRKFRPKHDSGEFRGETLNRDEQPVVNVTLAEANEYCRWLDQQAGVQGVHRLATEAEWEYACRAGDGSRYFWASGPEGGGAFANGAGLEALTLAGIEEREAFPYKDAWLATAPVGGRKPNAFGLCDMLGNAAEWVSDRFGNYPSGAVKDPTGPATGTHAIARGGSFAEGPTRCRAAFRQALSESGHPTVGLRVVATRPIERK